MPEAGSGSRRTQQLQEEDRQMVQVGESASRLPPKTANHHNERVRSSRLPTVTPLLCLVRQKSGRLLSFHARVPPLIELEATCACCLWACDPMPVTAATTEVWPHPGAHQLMAGSLRQLGTTVWALSGCPWLPLATLVQPWDPRASPRADLPQRKHPLAPLWEDTHAYL